MKYKEVTIEEFADDHDAVIARREDGSVYVRLRGDGDPYLEMQEVKELLREMEKLQKD